MDAHPWQLLLLAVSGRGTTTGQDNTQGRALCLDAETVFEALVWVGASNDLWVGAAHVHVPLALDDVAAIALQPLDPCQAEHPNQDESKPIHQPGM